MPRLYPARALRVTLRVGLLLIIPSLAWPDAPTEVLLPTLPTTASDQDLVERLVPNAARGKVIASQACAKCHNADGNAPASSGAMNMAGNVPRPKLAGQLEGYLVKQLHDMRDDRRPHEIMKEKAPPLEDQDIVDLATFYASQLRAKEQRGDPLVARVGKKLYFEGRPADDVPPCVNCHGAKGTGYPGMFEGGFPAIGSQHSDYLRAQLRAFRDGKRVNDVNHMMQFATAQLSNDDIVGLSVYVAGLVPPNTLRAEWEKAPIDDGSH